MFVDASLRSVPALFDLESACTALADTNPEVLDEHAQQLRGKIWSFGARFYDQFLEQRFGNTFKGIFLFSAADYTCFRLDYSTAEGRAAARPAGHWDYADIAYRQIGSPNPCVSQARLSELRALGLSNAEMIPSDALFIVNPESSCWDGAVQGNKTTRLLHWGIGDWPARPRQHIPPEVSVGSYDVVFLQSDQSGYYCAARLALALAHSEGIVVVKSRAALLPSASFLSAGNARPLLIGEDVDYNAFVRL